MIQSHKRFRGFTNKLLFESFAASFASPMQGAGGGVILRRIFTNYFKNFLFAKGF
jgi:hypothetical protein